MNRTTVLAASLAASAGVAYAGTTDVFFAEATNIDIPAWNSGDPLPGNPALDAVVNARNNFVSGFGTIFEEDFENVPLGPATSGTSLSFDGIDAMLTGPGEVRAFPPGLNDRFSTSGERYFDTQANPNNPVDSSPPFTVSFSRSIQAFGFYATDVGDFGGQIQLVLDGNLMETVPVPNAVGSNGSTDPSVLFFGFRTDAGFDEIRFLSSAEDADGFGFDDMIFGDNRDEEVIPLPTASLLAFAGLLGVAGLRRR